MYGASHEYVSIALQLNHYFLMFIRDVSIVTNDERVLLPHAVNTVHKFKNAAD